MKKGTRLSESLFICNIRIVAIKRDCKFLPPKTAKPKPKNVGWIKRVARIHQSAETIHWWKRQAFSTLH